MKNKIKSCILVGILIIIIMIILCCVFFRTVLLKKFYRVEYQNCVEKYSEEFNVDKYLIYSIIKAESNFNEKAVSGKDAKGLMQLMDSTADELAKKLNLEISEETILNPDNNIRLGTYYTSLLIEKYNSIELAVSAYNAGSGNVDNWIKDGIINNDGSNIENIPYKETNIYVRKILNNYKIYTELYK